MTTQTNEARSRAREVALQVLFATDLQQRRERKAMQAEAARAEAHPGTPAVIDALPVRATDEIFTSVAEHFEMPKAAHDFARHLAAGVIERRDGLDAVIAEHANNWRVERMAIVDRNILRLATWELRYSDTPAAVVLDEAIELARRFGSDTSPAFVNGVLDAIAKRVEAGP